MIEPCLGVTAFKLSSDYRYETLSAFVLDVVNRSFLLARRLFTLAFKGEIDKGHSAINLTLSHRSLSRTSPRSGDQSPEQGWPSKWRRACRNS